MGLDTTVALEGIIAAFAEFVEPEEVIDALRRMAADRLTSNV